MSVCTVNCYCTVSEISMCPGFRWGRVNFPPSSCCVLDLVGEKMLTLMVLVAAKKSRLFPVSHIQLMSRYAVSAREHSQAASPSWPMEIFHTMESCSVYKWGLARKQEALFQEFSSLFPSSKFLLGSKFFQEFCEIHKFHSRCSGIGCVSVIGQ